MSPEVVWLTALPFALASVVFTIGLARSWTLGIASVSAIYVLDAGSAGLPGIDVGLIIVYPQDWLFICIAAASVAGRHYQGRGAVWLLATLALIAFARGASEFSLKQAGVDLRSTFYFLSALNYFASLRFQSEREIVLVTKWIRFTGTMLLLTAVVRWILLGIASPLTASWQSISGTTPLRVINAPQTLMLFQFVVFGIAGGDSSKVLKLLRNAIVGAGICAVIVLQHRTVWVLAAVTVIALWFLNGMAIRMVVRRAIAPLLAAMIMALIVATVQFERLYTSLTESAHSAFSEDSTLGWRVEVWQRVIGDETERRPFEYLVGQPFGSRYFAMRDIDDDIDVSPHNFYVQTFARMGFLGLIALILVYRSAFRSASAVKSADVGPRQMLVVLVIGQLVYACSYSPDYMQALILGSALALPAKLLVHRVEERGHSVSFAMRREAVISQVRVMGVRR